MVFQGLQLGLIGKNVDCLVAEPWQSCKIDQVHPGEAAVAPPVLDDSQQPAVLLKRPVPDGAQTKDIKRQGSKS